LDRPILVGVAGGTSAGKSTFAGRIAEAIGPERALIIAESSYYFDRSHFRVDFPEQVNFDHPDSIDLVCMESHLKDLIAGRAVPQFHYHRDTGVREETGKMVEPRQVIIVEGILILAEEKIRSLLDIKIFIDADSDLRFIRRLERDLTEKGIPFEEICSSFLEKVKPMHLRFVMPSKRYADIIVPMGGQNEAALEMVVSRIQSYLG